MNPNVDFRHLSEMFREMLAGDVANEALVEHYQSGNQMFDEFAAAFAELAESSRDESGRILIDDTTMTLLRSFLDRAIARYELAIECCGDDKLTAASFADSVAEMTVAKSILDSARSVASDAEEPAVTMLREALAKTSGQLVQLVPKLLESKGWRIPINDVAHMFEWELPCDGDLSSLFQRSKKKLPRPWKIRRHNGHVVLEKLPAR